jgi:hypothetical protein
MCSVVLVRRRAVDRAVDRAMARAVPPAILVCRRLALGTGFVALLAGCGDLASGGGAGFAAPPEGFPPVPVDPAPILIPYSPRPEGTITYTRDVAPIVLRHCASCHGGESGSPPPLTTFEEVRDAGEAVVRSLASGSMPPWLPEFGYAHYVGERGLTPTQVGLVRQWVGEGMAEGDPADLLPPPPPRTLPPEPDDSTEFTVVLGADAAHTAMGTVYDTYLLAEELEVRSVLPDAGEFGVDYQAWAYRPDGSREWLLRIGDWDPAWRERYRFEQPIVLPRGSVIALQVTFDSTRVRGGAGGRGGGAGGGAPVPEDAASAGAGSVASAATGLGLAGADTLGGSEPPGILRLRVVPIEPGQASGRGG